MHSWLGTVSALTQLDLSDEAVKESCGGALPEDLEFSAASVDLYYGF